MRCNRIHDFSDIDNKHIMKALALVLSPALINVKIIRKDVTSNVIRLQKDSKTLKKDTKIKNPFTKTLDEMLDEQFFDENKNIMVQMQLDICVHKCVNKYCCKSIFDAI